MKIQVQKNKIKVTELNDYDEGETINEIRDIMENTFSQEIREGKTLYFEDWNLQEGYINYNIV